MVQEAQFARDGIHLLHGGGLIFGRHVIKGVVTFAPTATAHGGKLDDRVQRHFQGHAHFHAGVAKVGHEALQNANVTHQKRWNDFLLDVDHDAGQARHEVTVTFPARKAAK